MKKILVFIFFIVSHSMSQQSLIVMSFNIRLDVASDGVNAWEHRKEMVVDLIRYHKADLFGLQEALPHQLDYLVQAMPEYGWFGVGRDDGKRAGEVMAILYRKERLDTIRTSTLWCSADPSKPGLGWDAACNRTITRGRFRDKLNGRIFHHLNTHLDHVGVTARGESAKLLRSIVDEQTGEEPVIITGDFNTPPDSDPYRTMTDKKYGKKIFDSFTISKEKHYGPVGTFTGFDITAAPTAPIDFIFVSEDITVLQHATLSESINGRFPSDHFPVIAEIELSQGK